MIGATANVFKAQMLNVIINQFFNPIVVTARSIALSVEHAAFSLSHNFYTAMRPQIIKNYAAGQKEEMLSLMFSSSKITYLLTYLIALPLILEMPIILKLWLKNRPEYTTLFAQLALIDVLVNTITYPVMAAIGATGKIKLFQSLSASIVLLNIPASLVVLQMGAPPYSIMIIVIILSFINGVMRLLILKTLINYSFMNFCKMVILPVLIISIVSAILPSVVYYVLPQNIIRFCLVTGMSILSISLFSYFIGLNKDEKQKLRTIITKYISSKKGKLK
jgi:O-antigen/teichoic acid export membrane protein